MIRRIGHRLGTAATGTRSILQRAQRQLQTMRPLVQRILTQTRARLLGGDTHVADKVLSVFEPRTEGIRKGRIAAPTEFGKLVTIQEAEHQIITAYEVHARRPADKTLWVPALDRHQQIFGRAPDLAAGDRGFRIGRERERRVCTRSPTRRVAAGRPQNTGAARPRTATLAWPAVARRLRRTNQCAQTSTWTPTQPLAWRRRYQSMGGSRGHRQQPRERRHRPAASNRRMIETGEMKRPVRPTGSEAHICRLA